MVNIVKPVILHSSLDHREYIDELSYKDSHFLAVVSVPPVFVDYQAPYYFLNIVRLKTKGVKLKFNPEEPTSSIGDNIDSDRPSSPIEDGERNGNGRGCPSAQ